MTFRCFVFHLVEQKLTFTVINHHQTHYMELCASSQSKYHEWNKATMDNQLHEKRMIIRCLKVQLFHAAILYIVC